MSLRQAGAPNLTHLAKEIGGLLEMAQKSRNLWQPKTGMHQVGAFAAERHARRLLDARPLCSAELHLADLSLRALLEAQATATQLTRTDDAAHLSAALDIWAQCRQRVFHQESLALARNDLIV